MIVGYLAKDVKSAPMDEAESGMFLRLMMSDEDKLSNDVPKEDLEKDPIYAILSSRLAIKDVDCETRVKIFISLLCKGIPGKATLWAYTLYLIWIKNNKQKVTMENIADEFPWGFPDEESCHKAWDAQKKQECPLGNFVDDPDSWPTEQSEIPEICS